MKQSPRILQTLAVSTLVPFCLISAGRQTLAINDDLQSFHPCVMEPMQGADGDSFQVKFPDGVSRVIRLYGVDCIEANIWDEADSRRLQEQRRYFGISDCRPTLAGSVAEAKRFGKVAADEVQRLLRHPFTVHTAFADGRGSGYQKRIYAFVTTADGQDLGTVLVSRGLARAFGVCRPGPDGLSGQELRERLEDLELKAAREGAGIWALTNWDRIVPERLAQRHEEAALADAMDRKGKDASATNIVDPNTAARDELMTLPGIGEALALRIIENRPYRTAEDLLGVKSLGLVTLKRIENRLPDTFRVGK